METARVEKPTPRSGWLVELAFSAAAAGVAEIEFGGVEGVASRRSA